MKLRIDRPERFASYSDFLMWFDSNVEPINKLLSEGVEVYGYPAQDKFPAFWGPFYQSSKDIASTIAAELWTEIERLRGALTEIVIKPDDGRDRRIEIKYHNPYKVASDALTESKARFGEIER